MNNAKQLAIILFPSHCHPLIQTFLKWKSYVNYISFSLLENQKLYNIHFFSALTLGLKKDDMGFMPVLSTFARLFWAALIFLGGWNKGKKKINTITQRLCTETAGNSLYIVNFNSGWEKACSHKESRFDPNKA